MKNISVVIGFIFIVYSSLTWATSTPPLLFTNASYQLVMHFSYDSNKQIYQANYKLVNREHNTDLNKGQFQGCTYGGVINNIVDYIQKRKFINVIAIPNGFAIYFVVGCGSQSIWRLNIVTSQCVASVPATDRDGNPVDIGADPHKINFGYLTGVGAARKVMPDYLMLTSDGKIQLSPNHGSTDEVSLNCH